MLVFLIFKSYICINSSNFFLKTGYLKINLTGGLFKVLRGIYFKQHLVISIIKSPRLCILKFYRNLVSD